ncbi:Ig-like domain-containing protein [Streptomyces cellulosae]|uniref:glycine-rich protein n=1 Tax=Streptomyces cellulosae TaxID=1968 RepID=UPI00131CABC4|nr:glycine-rich protein [Streptomyces cellulosae]
MMRDLLELRRVRLRRGAATVALVALGAGGSWAAVPAAAAGTAAAGSPCAPTAGFTGCRLFDFTGAKAAFQVPSGVNTLDVRAWGQGGWGGHSVYGGAGGYTAGTLKVTPGESLSVAVGGYESGKSFGDAFGGAPGGGDAKPGGNSSAIRADGGEALVIAGGGGGSGSTLPGPGYGGVAGGDKGQDGSESGFAGKGADKGTGGAGAGNGAAGADATAGGRGGDGGKAGYGGGGGGAGYAGGGGGAGAEDERASGSGGGGTGYTNPDRVSDARMASGVRYTPPVKDDPFWSKSPWPETAGVAEGGTNLIGGNGRVVIQWKGAVAPAELSPASPVEQSHEPSGEVPPMAAVVRDKAGKPVEGVSVKFAFDDPAKLGLNFGNHENTTSVVLASDAQGRVQTPAIDLLTSKKGDFTVHATAPGGLSTDFIVHVRNLANGVEVLAGDKQQAEPGQPFPEVLKALVTDEGKPAAGVNVNFLVRGGGWGSPEFEGKYAGSRETTDAEGKVSSLELVAGDELGTYTVTASVDGGASASFTVEVVEKVETDPSASPSPTPSPSGSADGVTGGTGDGNGSGGTDRGGSGTGGSGTGGSGTGGSGSDNTSPLSGGLASTGAGGIGLMLGAAAALAALGVAAVRFSPRLRMRFQNHR